MAQWPSGIDLGRHLVGAPHPCLSFTIPLPTRAPLDVTYFRVARILRLVYAVNMRLTHPSARIFVEVPHYIVATNSPPGAQRKIVGMEAIVLEFTTRPNSPLLAMISRVHKFAPMLAGNLVDEVRDLRLLLAMLAWTPRTTFLILNPWCCRSRF